MIFNTFDPNRDIVAGRTTRIASGFWPNGITNWSQSFFEDDFSSLVGSSGTPSYGTSFYDVRRTMYYTNVYPHPDYKTNSDPYFSVTYGHIGGDVGSGSFGTETSSIQASPTKAIYTQYKNMLLGTSDLDGVFNMKSGSTNITASDIWVIDFSAYKMKDRIDEGLLEFTLSGSAPDVDPFQVPFIDDSRYTTQNQSVYQIISGSLDNLPSEPNYEGLGLFYPANGIVILNAAQVAKKLGMPAYPLGVGNDGTGPGDNNHSWPYNPELTSDSQFTKNAGYTYGVGYTYNHRTLYWLLKLANATLKVRKSEYVPARHYFIRVMNRDFNYSNNPTYVWDGTDGIIGHIKGTIRNTDFISDPRTYITTVGLYNDTNELVAVAKLSRPALKTFDQELLIKCRLDF